MQERTRLAIAIAISIATSAAVPAADLMVASAQTFQTKRVMQQKLAASQQLLAAVVTSNWAALDRHTRAVEALTRDPGWDVMRLPEYHDQTVMFQRALGDLRAAAGQRDQRTAVAAYNALVSSCVDCHRYVARARIARAK
jgi:hypothetical protein